MPLGPPIDNTRFYVLDDTGAILPPGVRENCTSAEWV